MTFRSAFIVFCLAASASAQTVSLSVSGTGTFNDLDYTTQFTMSGSATLAPGGAATLSITSGSQARERGLSCLSPNILLPVTLTTSTGDKMTLLLNGSTLSATTSSVSLNLIVTGGTGAFNNANGSGTMTLNSTITGSSPNGNNGGNTGTFTFTGTGSVTLSSTYVRPPVIAPSGVVPLNSEVPIIQPGAFISIFGNYLAGTTAAWTTPFPTSLAGVSVTIDGNPAFLYQVSPGQINVQAPDDSSKTCVNVTVNGPNGQASTNVLLQKQSPSLITWGDAKQHAIGYIYDSSVPAGFTYLLPAGQIAGLTSRAAKAGETISLFGVGFGPVQTKIPAGQIYSPTAANLVTTTLSATIGGRGAPVQAALVAAGEYQLNLQIPQGLTPGDQTIVIYYQGSGNPVIGDNYQSQVNPIITIPVQ